MTRTAVNKYFMVSVATATAFDDSGNILFTGKTLMDSNVTIKTSNTDIRGGVGAKLQYIYWHSSDWTGTIQDVQFNLSMIGTTLGSDITTGANVYASETLTLGGGGTGTVTGGTPLSDQTSGTIYGWCQFADGNIEKVTFTGSNFTASTGVSGDVVCISYYQLNSSAKSITVKSNIIPKIARLILDTQLASSDSSSNIVGKVEIIIPRAQFTGSLSITMKADGVSSTPLDYRALSYNNPNSIGGCADTEAYGYINRIVDSSFWYSDLIALAIKDGDFTLAVAGTKTLIVYAVHSDGSSEPAPVADLTFTSSVPGKATAGLHTGLCTGVSSGTTIISVYPTAAPTFDAAVTCTVS